MRYLLLAVALSMAFARPAPAAPAPGEMLPNGGMEAPFQDGLAQGWVRNCYGENTAVFAPETKDVHAGEAAQRVTCTDFRTGGVQWRCGGVSVEKGKPYTLSLWLKADTKSHVYMGVRKHDAPYTGYLKRYVRPKNEWRHCILVGEASDTDPDCGIYLMFAGTGTVLVDDVSLLPGAHEEEMAGAGQPPRKGNRVFNGGFEVGPEGWAPVGRFALDAGAAHSGRVGARVNSGGVESRPFPVRPAMRCTLSAWVKAAKPDTRVELKLFEWADDGGDAPSRRHQRVATVTAGTEWTRCQVSGVLLPLMWEDYVARITPAGDASVDDVQVEEGDATDYAPAAPVEVGLESETRWCLAGEKVTVTAHVAGASGPVALTYTLEDFWGRPAATVTRRVTPDTPDRAVFAPPGLGCYRVRARAGDGPATGEVWFGVFPRRDRKPRPDSFFGTHVTAVVPEATLTMRVSEAMGARWVRLHDFGDFCHWRVVEPEKGRLVWCDAEVNDLVARGFTLLANLGHPPLWAGRPGGKRGDHGSWTDAPPRDPAEWENYVAQTVAHYKDRIRHWEVWNEPYGGSFFSGTPEEYSELLKIASRAIKRADPNAVVLGGCFSPYSPEWTKRVFAQGAYAFMDALSYHVYWGPEMTEAKPDEKPLLTQHVEEYVALMRAYGAPKPIYMTEGGIQCPPFASWLPKEGFRHPGEAAAAGLVKGMVQMKSAGVVNVAYYYTGGMRGAMPWYSTMANGYYVLADYDCRPKPTLMAYSALEMLLSGCTPLRVVEKDGLTAHLFRKGSGALAVLWSDRDRDLKAPGARAFDLMGNPLRPLRLRAGEPVYLESASAAALGRIGE